MTGVKCVVMVAGGSAKREMTFSRVPAIGENIRYTGCAPSDLLLVVSVCHFDSSTTREAALVIVKLEKST